MIGERLLQLRKRAGLAQIDLAVAMGDRYSPSMISQVETGQRTLRLDGAINAARELGVSLDYLVGLSDDPRPYSEIAIGLAELDALKHELGGSSVLYDPEALHNERAYAVDAASARYVEIHEVAAAAGDGILIEDAPVKGHLTFQRDWLKSHGIDPARCTVIGISGNSMEPTLPDGCSILVDHARQTRRRGRIYVLQTDDGLMVKRAGREKSGWQLISDNPYWPPAVWPDDAAIIGEVRWAARTF